MFVTAKQTNNINEHRPTNIETFQIPAPPKLVFSRLQPYFGNNTFLPFQTIFFQWKKIGIQLEKNAWKILIIFSIQDNRIDLVIQKEASSFNEGHPIGNHGWERVDCHSAAAQVAAISCLYLSHWVN